MKIYVGHATSFDFQNQLYLPLKASELAKEHTFTFPHDQSLTPWPTKNIISTCDLFIAEVSRPSIGLGIELGWANVHNRSILCIYPKGSKPSESSKIVTNDFVEYDSSNDLLKQVSEYITKLKILYKIAR
jgi:hypothetical protein